MITLTIKIIRLIFIIFTIPFACVYGFIKSILVDYKIKQYPLENIIKRTAIFVRPQLEVMKELEGNKFAFIDLASVLYINVIATEVGGRSLLKEEEEQLLLKILGDDYKLRIKSIFESINKFSDNPTAFKEMARNISEIARLDVHKGVFFCSSFLVDIAKESSEWQKTLGKAV